MILLERMSKGLCKCYCRILGNAILEDDTSLFKDLADLLWGVGSETGPWTSIGAERVVWWKTEDVPFNIWICDNKGGLTSIQYFRIVRK